MAMDGLQTVRVHAKRHFKAEFCMDLVNFVYTSDVHVFRCFLERLFFVFDMHFSVCTLSALQVFIERI